MNQAKVKSIYHYITTDNQKMSQLDVELLFPIHYELQPVNGSYIAKDSSLIKVGDIIDVSNQFYVLDNEEYDSWEFLGSDHNAAIVYYGSTVDIDNIVDQIQKSNSNFVSKTTLNEVDLSAIITLRWNLENNMSLCIHYCMQDNQDNIKAPNVISVIGGEIDDILISEIISFPLNKLVKKIKLNTDEENDEDFEDYSDYEEIITINGKVYKKEEKLLFGLGYTILCELLCVQNSTNEEDSLFKNLAQKLIILKQIKELILPKNSEEYHLVFQNETSHKQYDLKFINNNKEYIVYATYGKFGSKQQEQLKYKGSDIVKAQEIYISLLSEKLSKGYIKK